MKCAAEIVQALKSADLNFRQKVTLHHERRTTEFKSSFELLLLIVVFPKKKKENLGLPGRRPRFPKHSVKRCRSHFSQLAVSATTLLLGMHYAPDQGNHKGGAQEGRVDDQMLDPDFVRHSSRAQAILQQHHTGNTDES